MTVSELIELLKTQRGDDQVWWADRDMTVKVNHVTRKGVGRPSSLKRKAVVLSE